MKTIAQWWSEFELNVVPLDASATQRKEMRLAFYSGFGSCLDAIVNAADQAKDNDDVGATMLSRLHAEAVQFARGVIRGRA